MYVYIYIYTGVKNLKMSGGQVQLNFYLSWCLRKYNLALYLFHLPIGHWMKIYACPH